MPDPKTETPAPPSPRALGAKPTSVQTPPPIPDIASLADRISYLEKTIETLLIDFTTLRKRHLSIAADLHNYSTRSDTASLASRIHSIHLDIDALKAHVSIIHDTLRPLRTNPPTPPAPDTPRRKE